MKKSTYATGGGVCLAFVILNAIDYAVTAPKGIGVFSTLGVVSGCAFGARLFWFAFNGDE